MAQKSLAMLPVATGQGIVPRPNWLARVLTMFDVRRTRIELARLDDSQLHDIGLTRDQVQAELERPVWDVPANWRR
ncbi:DUF1127 domain-containing protein [Paracoccus siganidrum]|nr:DUF1127 domain-containing protein [Paracoccus siganidrum]